MDLKSKGKITEFLSEGVVEHPERFGEFFEDYLLLLRKIMPERLFNKPALIAVGTKNIANLCYIIDNERKKDDPEYLKSLPSLKGYFADSSMYGPATRALSNYLGLEGIALVMKIFSNQLN